MSSPSNMFFYDESTNLVALSFINAGWFINKDSLFEAIKKSYQELDASEGFNLHNKKTPSWKETTRFVKVYDLTISRSLLDRIVSGDQSAKQEIDHIIQTYIEKTREENP